MLGRFKGIALATTALGVVGLSIATFSSAVQAGPLYWDRPSNRTEREFTYSAGLGLFTNWKEEVAGITVASAFRSTEILVFGNTEFGQASDTARNNVDGLLVSSMSFADTAGEFRLEGDRISLGPRLNPYGLRNHSSSEQNIDFDVTVISDQIWETNGGVFDINGDVDLVFDQSYAPGDRILKIEGSGTTNIDGNLSGEANTTIEKNGSGTLVLDGSNENFQGDIDLNDGRLRLDGGDNVSTSTTIDISGDAVLDLNGTAEDIGGLSGTGGSVDLTSSASLAVGFNDDDTEFSGDIFGNGSFGKEGDGTLTLRGDNTYTGGTTVSGGTLKGDTDSLQGNITNNANVEFNNADADGTYAGNISGTGSTTISGGNVVTFAGNNGAATGDVVVTENSTLRAGPGNAIGNSTVVLNNGTLDLNGTVEDIGGLSGSNGQVDLSDSADLGVGHNDETTTFNGSIFGNGSLRKEGAGTLTLRGTNSYTGGTSVNEGVLEGDTDSLQGVISNSTFVRFDQDTSGTFNGTINGAGSVTKRGNGTVTLNGTNSYTGGTRIERGTLRGTTDSLTGDLQMFSSNSGVEIDQNFNANFGNEIIGNGSLTKSGSGTVTLTGNVFNTGGTFVNSGTLRGTTDNLGGGFFGTLRTDGRLEWNQSSAGTIRRNISGTGDVTISGGGTVQFDGNNSYQGTTRVSGSTLRLGTGNALSGSTTVALSNGTLDFDGTAEDFGGLSGSGTVDLSSSAAMGVGYNNANTTFSGAITGNGTLRKEGTGTLTLTGNNSYSGATTVNNGQLRLTGSGDIDQSSSLTVGANGTFSAARFIEGCSNFFCGGPFPAEHGYSYGGTVNNQGTIRGGNGVTSGTGTGALTLTGNVSGAGSFEDVVVINGTFRPGNSPALITAETLSFGASNALFMEIGGYGRGSEFDAIDATSITLDGLLDIALLDLGNNFTPMAGNTFDLIIANQIIGEFSSFNFAALAEGLFWTTQLISGQAGMIYQLVVDGQLVGVAVPAPGALILLLVGVASVGVMRRRKA